MNKSTLTHTLSLALTRSVDSKSEYEYEEE